MKQITCFYLATATCVESTVHNFTQRYLLHVKRSLSRACDLGKGLRNIAPWDSSFVTCFKHIIFLSPSVAFSKMKIFIKMMIDVYWLCEVEFRRAAVRYLQAVWYRGYMLLTKFMVHRTRDGFLFLCSLQSLQNTLKETRSYILHIFTYLTILTTCRRNGV
jgi:hypothetical protein